MAALKAKIGIEAAPPVEPDPLPPVEDLPPEA
jgi:hypothetical protein